VLWADHCPHGRGRRRRRLGRKRPCVRLQSVASIENAGASIGNVGASIGEVDAMSEKASATGETQARTNDAVLASNEKHEWSSRTTNATRKKDL
jgi:hypothetical protein